ncbi:hypothetical protein PoB_003073500 [Plakobranchus ocellatus]|uniref:Uncharacterized protein n=1 Tax=Plakobranchus ocellatus TaxID=259542 RepID=A0AAV4ABM7_9GAST|nr:hypothetical protein PoB_003073500 [Plakobranchus ocellatus]
MQEISGTFLITLLSTTAAVAMAAILFCCWGKKSSYDAGDTPAKSPKNAERKSAKTSQPNGDNVGENSTSLPHKTEENGSASANNSTVEIVVDSSDLGDFSAVSRETEILRSYRKPPPPKNRARQSRAPRAAFKSSTENLDIFTELSEDNNIFNLRPPDPSDGGEPGSGDQEEVDISLLRPKPDDSILSGSSRREDVRSSMLADIEQTLAALHLKAEQTSEDNATDNNEDACVQDKVATVSSRPSSHLVESVHEHDASSARSSPRTQSPLTKPKIGPKVSPKPAIRKQFLNVEQVKPQEKQTPAATKEEGESSVSKSVSEAISKPEPKESSQATNTPVSIKSGQDEGGEKSNLPNIENSISSATDSSHQESKEDATDLPHEEHKPTTAAKSTEPQITEPEKETEISETPSVSEKEREETVFDQNPENVSSSHTAEPEEKKPHNPLTNGTATEQPPAEQTEATHPPAPTEAPEQTSAEGETPRPAADDNTEDGGRGGGPHKEEALKKGGRQDSTEEPTGKTKISKIPVRAGSKPRSSPPKAEKQEGGQ